MDVTEQCKIKTDTICVQLSNNAKNMSQLRMCFGMSTVLGKKKYTILAKRQTHNYHSCSVCFSGLTIELWSHPIRIPKIMITAHLITLHS